MPPYCGNFEVTSFAPIYDATHEQIDFYIGSITMLCYFLTYDHNNHMYHVIMHKARPSQDLLSTRLGNGVKPSIRTNDIDQMLLKWVYRPSKYKTIHNDCFTHYIDIIRYIQKNEKLRKEINYLNTAEKLRNAAFKCLSDDVNVNRMYMYGDKVRSRHDKRDHFFKPLNAEEEVLMFDHNFLTLEELTSEALRRIIEYEDETWAGKQKWYDNSSCRKPKVMRDDERETVIAYVRYIINGSPIKKEKAKEAKKEK